MLMTHGVMFPDDPNVLTPVIRDAIRMARFEAREAATLHRIVRRGERVLELGAGTGFISTLLDRLPEVEQVWAVEANPDLMDYMQRLHLLNGCTKVQRVNAVLSDTLSGAVPFYHRPDFWMGSLLDGPNPYCDVSMVAVEGLSRFIARHRISLIVCDIEGAECDLFDKVDLTGVNVLQVEVHDHISGLAGVQRLIRHMDAKGLLYDPRDSGQSLMVFRRIAQPERLRPYEEAMTLVG